MTKFCKSAWVALAALCSPALTAQAQQAKPPVPREFPKAIEPSKIVLVGDSTTAVIGGWGPSFCAYHVTSFVACVDLARGGRSSRTYMQEKSWDLALKEAQVPGYRNVWVLIQFGHNDQPGNSRSTELAQEFPGYIRRYVDDAKAAGATPILVTPLVRRTFKDGKLVNDLAPWAEAVRQVAKETGALLIDLNALSAQAAIALGQQQSESFAQLPRSTSPAKGAPARAATEVNVQPTASVRLSYDDTHLGEEGADYIAAMMAQALADTVAPMRSLLVVERRPDRRPAALNYRAQ
ncbi:rhamnogalacturonan acetylesterase [Novosphingobium gossypii]|uniref:rhamnogalacturonan acetylesterase n=1 Tax=Novosphingobium gossypii TaxID=1604774 RepID=UPI003D1DFE9C